MGGVAARAARRLRSATHGLRGAALTAALAALAIGPTVEQGSTTANAAGKTTAVQEPANHWSMQRIGERVPGGIDEYTYGLALSPDGRRIATLGERLRIWDAASGEPIGTPRNIAGQSLAWSPDGSTIAVGTIDGRVLLTDSATGRELWRTPVADKAIAVLAFSPDGEHLAVGSGEDKVVRLLTAKGKEICRTPAAHREHVTALAFAERGKTLVSAGWDGTLRQWDVESCQERRAPIESKNGMFRGLALHPNGRMVAVAGREGPTVNDRHGGVEFWDLETGQAVAAPLKGYGGPYGIGGLAFSADGERLMVADGSGGLALIDWKTGRLIARGAAEHEDVIVWRTVFSPKEDLVATAGKDRVLGLWSAKMVPPRAAALALTEARTISVDGLLPTFSDDGRLVAFVKENDVLVRETDRGKVILQAAMKERVSKIALSSDGQWLVTYDRRVRLWHVPTKRQAGEWDIFYAETFAFDPSNTRLAIGAFSTVTLVDCTSGQSIGHYQIGTNPHHPLIWQLLFDPAGKRLLALTQEGDVHRLDAATLRPAAEPWPGLARFGALAFSPDGRRLAVARRVGHRDAVQLVVLDAASGAQLAGPMEEGSGWVHASAFTPDGRYLLVAGGSAISFGTVSLWDTMGGERLGRVLAWQQGARRGMRFSRDLRHFDACDMGSYTQTDCQRWAVSLNVPQHPVSGEPKPAARVTQATVAQVAEIDIGSLSNAIDFQSNRLAVRAGNVILLNNGVSRLLLDRADSSAPTTLYEDSALSADGRHATVALYDNQLAIFDFKSGELVRVVELAANYHAVHTFLPDGSLALDDGKGSLRIVDPKSGDRTRTLRYPHPAHGHITVLAAGVQLPLLVLGTDDGALLLGRTDTANPSFRVIERAHRGAVVTVALSVDERWLATGGVDGRIRLFDAQTGASVGGPWTAHARAVTAIGFNEDASLLASGSTDGTVRLWNVQTGQAVTDALIGHTEPVLAIAFHDSTGQILSFGRDRTLRQWRIASPSGVPRGSARGD